MQEYKDQKEKEDYKRDQDANRISNALELLRGLDHDSLMRTYNTAFDSFLKAIENRDGSEIDFCMFFLKKLQYEVECRKSEIQKEKEIEEERFKLNLPNKECY